MPGAHDLILRWLPDGTVELSFADAHEEQDAELALVLIPGLEESAAETESVPLERTWAEFERLWEQCRAGRAYWKAELLTTTRGDFLWGGWKFQRGHGALAEAG